MLYGYPVAATQDNWLHDCLCEAVRAIHAVADASKPYPKWPKILPPAHQSLLESRTGLRDRLKAYDRAVRKLSIADRALVFRAVDAENRISDLLSATSDCASMDDFPDGIRGPVADLFGYAFNLLSDLEVRDQQYAAIYAAAIEHICPFCGTEYFDAPGAVREPLDHYLARSRYPFAAANLRNLVPMGHKCNSSYKLASDLLRCSNGTRRRAFDPYNHGQLAVSLDDSIPFGGTTENTPKWNIRFCPDTPEVSTWDEVFGIHERYRRDHLDPWFENWLRLFVKWARGCALPLVSDSDLIFALRRYEENWTDSGFADRAFLKGAVFRMLRKHCEAGDQRLLRHLRMQVDPSLGALPA